MMVHVIYLCCTAGPDFPVKAVSQAHSVHLLAQKSFSIIH